MINLDAILSAITSTDTMKVKGSIPPDPDNIISIRMNGGDSVRHFGGKYVGSPTPYIEVRNATYDGGMADLQAIFNDLAKCPGVVLNKEVRGLGMDIKGRSGFGIDLKVITKE